MPAKIVLNSSTGMIAFGVAIVEGFFVTLSIAHNILAIHSVDNPNELISLEDGTPILVADETHSGPGYFLRFLAAVVPGKELWFECHGHIKGMRPPMGFSIPLLV
jgi:hypothetical protein